MSRTLATKSGSADNLNLKVCAKRDLTPKRENHLCTVLFDTPSLSAVLRTL